MAKTARKLHEEAMNHVDQAMKQERLGDFEGAKVSYKSAADLEAKAMNQAETGSLTQMVLCRSGASLAIKAEDFKLAKLLVARGEQLNIGGSEIADTWQGILEVLEKQEQW